MGKIVSFRNLPRPPLVLKRFSIGNSGSEESLVMFDGDIVMIRLNKLADLTFIMHECAGLCQFNSVTEVEIYGDFAFCEVSDALKHVRPNLTYVLVK